MTLTTSLSLSDRAEFEALRDEWAANYPAKIRA